jgi:hypothetical protein
MFLLYFLCRFIDDPDFVNKAFSLEFKQGQYHYFEPVAGSPHEFNYSCRDYNLKTADILVLADISDATEPLKLGKWLLIFSSPNEFRYKERIKTTNNFRYCMPTRSESELLCLNPLRDKWYNRFALFGGVPRHVLPNSESYDPHLLLDQTLTRKGVDVIKHFFGSGHGGVDLMQPYMLVHINPQRGTAEDIERYVGMVYSFASDEIFRKLCRKHDENLIAQARSILMSALVLKHSEELLQEISSKRFAFGLSHSATEKL